MRRLGGRPWGREERGPGGGVTAGPCPRRAAWCPRLGLVRGDGAEGPPAPPFLRAAPGVALPAWAAPLPLRAPPAVLPAARRAQLLPLDHPPRPPRLSLRHHPRALHASVGLHPRQLQGRLPRQLQRLLRAGPHRPLHHLGAGQLPDAAPRGEPAGRAAAGAVPPPQTPPGLHQADATPLDDPGPAGQGALCRLPLQRHRRQLGAQEARLGDAHGELLDGDGHPLQGGAGARSLPRPGGREDEEDDGCGGEGGGAVSPAERAQLLPGKEALGPRGLSQEVGAVLLAFWSGYGGEPRACCSGVGHSRASADLAWGCPFSVAPSRAVRKKRAMRAASAVCLSCVSFIGGANVQGVNVCVRWLATCEGNFHTSRPVSELGKKWGFLFVCF